MEQRSRSRVIDSIRTPATWVGETLYVLAAIALGLIVVAALIGLNPFTAPAVAAALVVIPVIFLGRRRWYRRHREEIEGGQTAHARRERRGF